jgi:hypothetical protein
MPSSCRGRAWKAKLTAPAYDSQGRFDSRGGSYLEGDTEQSIEPEERNDSCGMGHNEGSILTIDQY